MNDTLENQSQDTLEAHLAQVQTLLGRMRLVEELVHKQGGPRQDLVENLVHKQNLSELRRKLEQLHPADIAYILEALPLDERRLVWDLVGAENDGEILLEVSDSVRESLISTMDKAELLAAAESLDTDEIADIAADLPQDVIQELLTTLDVQKRARLQSALSYPEDSVGALMDFEMVTIRADVTIEVALRYLRRLGELPDQLDKLFVVDEDALIGVLPLKRLLTTDPEASVAAVMVEDFVRFHPEDEAHEASQAFERYDLVMAPVVDARGRLIGRLTVDAVVDYIRESADADMLSMAGLKEEEDLFSTVWNAAKNRWMWLAINLATAFIASRVIGAFEGSIEKLAALAALMPIIAGIGGNSGNQTITLIIRGLALGHITPANARRLVVKELGVATLNGVVWGSVVGVFAWLLYDNPALGGVMALAMLLNLLVAALAGIFIPMTLERVKRDPAIGSSVLLTFVTDSMGFFIFLGLATLLLL
ncbi:MAG: magnesium transporter [Hydrogenophilales bacterium 16-64-46]|nr:MAG: magnesium transporter [Hydrogenophilales bacterium 12-64-13]OYZ06518.1 MAG: magnesium transporter [Hydrogenophilales bacterium 16-64-46]OZA39226.1 MAG: magnesium transporter [Hydrogenophilales bacterium 17-64-34]HQS98777.1 magnesium transporter [Thiobacillus sp.]